jgi:hypothetical protein
MTMPTYKVTAPLVQVRRTDGSYVHVYEGGVLPDEADPEHVKQLLDGKMIASGGSSESADDGDTRPAGNASHDEWAAYAVSQGMSEEEAAGKSRDELRDLYK